MELRQAAAAEPEVRDFLQQRGSAVVARRGELVDALARPAGVATDAGAVAGVLTYDVVGDSCEILDKAHDLAYIRTSSTVPLMCDGNLTSPYKTQVTGVARPAHGMRVCTSGAVSGARCAGTVGNWGYVNMCAWNRCYRAALWFADGNVRLGAHGDSGGPVFVRRGNGVVAVGSISVGSTDGTDIGMADVYTKAWRNHHLSMTKASG